MDEVVVGRLTCEICGGSGSVSSPPIDPVDPDDEDEDGEAYCSCAVQLQWDGRTLWVNDSSGSSLARFGPAGIDIHRPSAEQMDGAHQCLDCKSATVDDVMSGKFGRTHRLWSDFERGLLMHYGVVIPEYFL